MEITSLNIKRNLVKLYIVSCTMVPGIMGFAQYAFANPIAVPPQGYVSPSPPPADSSGSDLYMVIGGVIVVVMLISLIILLRLRKKCANK